jgi:membrane-associated phospholipid phosphatase
MFSAIQRIKVYLIVVFSVFVAAGFLVLVVDREALHLAATAWHPEWLDLFFKHGTEIGHGVTCVVVVIVVAILHWRNFLPVFLIGVLAYATSGLLIQFLKRFVFADVLRPIKIIGADKLHIVEGVKLNEYFTFPSGHACTTMAMMTFIALLLKNKPVAQFIVAIIGLVGMYSRVYLSQHFVQDVLAGGAIGIFMTLIVYSIMSRYTFNRFFTDQLL